MIDGHIDEPKGMSDNEIIKAIECCINDDCDNCPNGFGNCQINLAKASLDLINRTKRESNKYRGKCTAQKRELTRLYKQIGSQKAEIKRLRCYVQKHKIEKDITYLYRTLKEMAGD